MPKDRVRLGPVKVITVTVFQIKAAGNFLTIAETMDKIAFQRLINFRNIALGINCSIVMKNPVPPPILDGESGQQRVGMFIP